MNPFEIVGSISEKTEIEFDDKDYNAFIVNKALSYFQDSVLFANEMNRLSNIPERRQYEFLYGTLRPKRRFSKWAKKVQDENVKIVAEYHGFSSKRAREMIDILTPQDIEAMKSEMSKGGKQ